jgi:hypothetical protein
VLSNNTCTYLYINGKAKVLSALALATCHEGVRGGGGIPPHTLKLENRCVSFTFQLLYTQGQGHWHTMDWRMGQLQKQCECSVDEINLKINSFGVLHYVSWPTVTDALMDHSVSTFSAKHSLLGWPDSSKCQLSIYQPT